MTQNYENMVETIEAAGALANTKGSVEKERKRIESQIRTAARKATGFAKLSTADEKAGRDRAYFRREVERLTAECLTARGQVVVKMVAAVKPETAVNATGGDAE